MLICSHLRACFWEIVPEGREHSLKWEHLGKEPLRTQERSVGTHSVFVVWTKPYWVANSHTRFVKWCEQSNCERSLVGGVCWIHVIQTWWVKWRFNNLKWWSTEPEEFEQNLVSLKHKSCARKQLVWLRFPDFSRCSHFKLCSRNMEVPGTISQKQALK